MSKKIITCIIVFFLLLAGIDLIFRKPWTKDDQVAITAREGTTAQVQETVSTNQNNESTDADETQAAQESLKNIETPYFITNNNFSSDLYLNGEFSTNELGIFQDSLEVDDLNQLYNDLDLIYEVAHGNQDLSVLEGVVDSVMLSDEYHARFNGFMDELSKREQYSVYDSIKLGEGLYKVSILIQTPAGEGDSNFISDALLTTAIYNSVHNRLSFEDMTRRMPYDLRFEDDRFKMHIYMVENYTHDSKLYLALTSKLNEEIAIEDFPVIQADTVQPNGNEETIYFKINENGYVLGKDVTFYFVVDVSITVDEISNIKIANQ